VLAAERHARIVERVRSAQIVSTDALVRELRVSGETIRRDLVALENRGLLTRVHGGAASTEPTVRQEPSFEQRALLGTTAKNRIGEAAATLVRNGQIIMIDVGTTALAVARALPVDLTATVVTNSLVVATELANRPGLDVLVSGGRVRSGDLALSNATTAGFFAKVYPDIAFLGSGGLHAEAGLTDYYLDEIEPRQTVIRNARRSYVLVDAEKFGRVAGHHVCDLDALSGVIVNKKPEGALAAALAEVGAEICLG
jgi:DeoR family fructose operon transcriptional repressor